MRLCVIACQVFNRELGAAIAESPNICTVRWLPQGLHDTPDLLRRRLQQQIDLIEEENDQTPTRRKLDAIAVCYGFCGGGIAGLQAKSLPLILPRTEDCIGLLLGSQQRYLDRFFQYNGIYWLSSGWIEHADTPSRLYYDAKMKEYIMRYGEDNASWLLEQENAWIKRYACCTFIRSPIAPIPAHESYAKEVAVTCGWHFEAVEGSNALLTALLAGKWEKETFFVCPPYKAIEASNDDAKYKEHIE